MTGGWKGCSRITLVTLAAALAACVDARDVGGPAEVRPEAAVVATTGATYELLSGMFPSPVGNGASCDVRGQEPSTKLQSAAWIDGSGGQLTISGGVLNGRVVGHTLTVPPQTVATRTLFCMRLVPTNHMQVKLEALALDAAGNVINVGAAGFRQPVLLSMSYAPLSLSPLLVKQLAVVHDRENGAPVEPTRSALQLTSLRIQAELDHFSTYKMGYSKYAMAVD